MSSECWRDAADAATTMLAEAGVDEAALNAELLALQVLGKWQRSAWRSVKEQPITETERVLYRELITRRTAREPLQYIIGETEFYGLRLLTTNAALIPRPETELLVQAAIEDIQRKQFARVLDIGTGTGAIALAIAKHAPQTTVLGIDKSNAAIELANQNRERLAVQNVSFDCSDFLKDGELRGKFDFVVSNPPYVSLEEMKEIEDELHYEPEIALTDFSDGLVFYRAIAQHAGKILEPDGMLILEIGFGRTEDIREILTAHGLVISGVIKDLAGIERVVSAKLDN